VPGRHRIVNLPFPATISLQNVFGLRINEALRRSSIPLEGTMLRKNFRFVVGTLLIAPVLAFARSTTSAPARDGGIVDEA
jgi:hypothetical protein